MSDLFPASRIFSRESSHVHCRIQAVSSRLSVLRRSHPPRWAMSSMIFCFQTLFSVLLGPKVSKVSGEEKLVRSAHQYSCFHQTQIVSATEPHWVHGLHQKSILGYRSCIFSLFLSRNITTSSGFIGSRIYVLQRDRRALITVKLGFSVVAPMRVRIHFSTHGRSTSCWDLDHLCISSRKSIVCRPSL